MNTETHLRVTHPLSSRIAIGATFLVFLWVCWALIEARAPRITILITGVVAVLLGWAFRLTLLPVCEVDAEGMNSHNWLGRRRFLRADLLGCEELGLDPRSGTRILVRFRTGVAILSEKDGCPHPQQVLAQLARMWNLKNTTHHRQATGPVEPRMTLRYERFHRLLIGLAVVALVVLGALSPLLWVVFIVAGFCARAFCDCLAEVSTDENGISLKRAGRAEVRIGWSEVESVRYWHSAFQGGVKIAGAGRRIRIYRWIENYPKLNRLMRDVLPPACFAPSLRLPLAVPMNGWRRTLAIPGLVALGSSVWFAFHGMWDGVAGVMALPSLAMLGFIAATGRTIYFEGETVRDVYRFLFISRTAVYRVSELEDIRLGRQFSAGGLWVRFGGRRLEIANAYAQVAPEEILAALRQAWDRQELVEPASDWVPEELCQ